MATITLNNIKEQLPPAWEVLSEKYVNLKTDMDFRCANGHHFTTSWEKLRKKIKCPICEQQNKDAIAAKNVRRILALDQATYNTGWSVFDNSNLIASGVFTSKLTHEIARDHEIKMWLLSMIEKWKPDLVGLEDIQHEENGKTVRIGAVVAKMLAHLQGILMEACYEVNVPYHVCIAGVWRSGIGVRGHVRAEQKKSMQDLAQLWYGKKVSDDEADAIGIGRYLSQVFVNSYKTEGWG